MVLIGWMLHRPPALAVAQPGQTAPSPPPAYRSSPSLIQNLVEAVSQEAIAQHILYLQDSPHVPGLDSQGTRHSRTPGLAYAATYIRSQFARPGLSVDYDEFLYFGTVMTNVVATLPGVGSESEGIYIVGAHFDSTAQRSPGWEWQTGPAPGADDNASGTAVVLELARVLSQEQFAHTLRFITFGGEEQGLLGSEHYAWEAWLAGQDIRGMINLDMVGWDGDGDRVMEVHAGTRPASIALAEVWKAALAGYRLNLVPQTLTVGATTHSDHASFWARGYPAILLIEDASGSGSDFNPYYHTTADTLDKLDMSYTVDFARATAAALAILARPMAPDLAVSKLGPATVLAGGLLTYTLAYSNAGAETATGVMLTEILPEGLFYRSDDSGLPGSDLGPGLIGWQIGTLAPGEGGSFNLVLALDVGLSPGTVLTNTMSIGGIEAEARLGNNAATSLTAVVTGPPAQLMLVTSPLAIPADGRTTAAITATVADGAGYPVENGTPVTFATSLGTVEPVIALTQNGVATTTLRSEQIVGAAQITATADPAWDETTVEFQPADVALGKVVEPLAVMPGGTVTYTLGFRNLGPAAATQVAVLDPLPPELHDPAYEFSGATVIPGDAPGQWRVVDLAPGEGGLITITARVDPSAFWGGKVTLDNEAAILSDTVDVHPENNSSAAMVALVRRVYFPLMSTSQ